MTNPYDHRYQKIREEMLQYALYCVDCNTRFLADQGKNHPRYPTIDHIVPLNAGGAMHDPNNMRAVCRSCNSSKGDTMRNPEDAPRRRNSRQW